MRPEDIEQDDGYAEDNATYLLKLAERLMHIPVMYDVDQGDSERLVAIAREMQAAEGTSA